MQGATRAARPAARQPGRAARPSRRALAFAADERGVSEVVGYILVFAILSIVLLTAMLASTAAHEAAEERLIRLRADSAADRVAAAVVNAALVAERRGDSADFEQVVDVPQQFRGRDWTVRIETAAPSRVIVTVSAISYEATAPLYAAAASQEVVLCASDVSGGRIAVRYDDEPVSNTRCVFLEDRP